MSQTLAQPMERRFHSPAIKAIAQGTMATVEESVQLLRRSSDLSEEQFRLFCSLYLWTTLVVPGVVVSELFGNSMDLAEELEHEVTPNLLKKVAWLFAPDAVLDVEMNLQDGEYFVVFAAPVGPQQQHRLALSIDQLKELGWESAVNCFAGEAQLRADGVLTDFPGLHFGSHNVRGWRSIARELAN